MVVFKLIVCIKQLFHLQKRLSKWCQRFIKNGLQKQGFCQKKLKLRVVRTIRFCSNFTSMWYKYLLRNVCRDLRLPKYVTINNGNTQYFYLHFYCKN